VTFKTDLIVCIGIKRAHGRWFSPGTPDSFTTKPGRHNIAEILLKMALSTINQIKSTLFEKRKFKQ
jgi:hypothetical protein